MNIECAVSVGCPGGPGDMVTAVVTATPDVFGGKMPWTLGDSGPPWSEPGTGAGGDHSLASPRGPVSVQVVSSRCTHTRCGVRVTERARAVTAWALTWAGQLAVSLSQERDTAWLGAWQLRDITWLRHITSLLLSSLLSCLLCHSCCQGSLPISELVLS